MSTIYSKTDNYGLNLYSDNDPADLRDGYNGSMHTIDTTLETHLNRIEGVEARETHDEAVMKALLVDNTVDNATTAKTKWDKASTDAVEAMADAASAVEKANMNATILTALDADTTAHATANKAKWDKASTDATSAITKADTADGKADTNSAILTALGADNVDSATAKKARWDNTYTKLESDGKYALKPVEQNLLVGIGDSYFEGFRTDNPATDSMIVKAAGLLGLECRNYAVGGSGYTIGGTKGKTFKQQLQQASAELGASKANVRYVVIGGGRNDSPSEVTGDIVYDTLTTAKTLFPDAEIVQIPMMWDNTWPTFNEAQKYGAMVEGGRRAVVKIVYDAPSWGLFWKSGMTDIHPNTQGSDIYAQYVAKGIKTGVAKRVEEYSNVTLSGIVDGFLKVFVDGLDVHFYFRGNKTVWNTDVFATVNEANMFGNWIPLFGVKESNEGYVKIKFNGQSFSIIDMLQGDGGAGYLDFDFSMSCFH
jgi:hypothetical protein|nr:MAG TPA: hypothetical protein [Caudoviricetes sp.]